MTGRLAGRKALIAGAGTGIGRATAERFAKEGAEIVLFGLGGATLAVAAEACGGRAAHGDVTSRADIAAAIAACGARLDILVNAVGFIQPDAPLTIADESWERIFSVNVGG
ncbi:MAG TPA: SDR family NAD(P)-dependent oxidoreductase, partial [Roseiarcus sp.]|nr:SDR family NAD(P)-dependent oxidoreductase [Roseiarcus sp.]